MRLQSRWKETDLTTSFSRPLLWSVQISLGIQSEGQRRASVTGTWWVTFQSFSILWSQFSSQEALEVGLTNNAFCRSWKNEVTWRTVRCLIAKIQVFLRQSSQGGTLDHLAIQILQREAPWLAVTTTYPLPPSRKYVFCSGRYSFPAHIVGWLTLGRVMDEVLGACVWQGVGICSAYLVCKLFGAQGIIQGKAWSGALDVSIHHPAFGRMAIQSRGL